MSKGSSCECISDQWDCVGTRAKALRLSDFPREAEIQISTAPLQGSNVQSELRAFTDGAGRHAHAHASVGWTVSRPPT